MSRHYNNSSSAGPRSPQQQARRNLLFLLGSMLLNILIILILPALSHPLELPLVFQVELVDPLDPPPLRQPPPLLQPDESLNENAAGSSADAAALTSPLPADRSSAAPTAASAPSNLVKGSAAKDAGKTPQPDRASQASTLTQVPQTNTDKPYDSTVVDTSRPLKADTSPEKVKPSGEAAPSSRDADASQKAADAQTSKPAVRIDSNTPARKDDKAGQPSAKPAEEQHSPDVKVSDKPSDKKNDPAPTDSPQNSPDVNVSADKPNSDTTGAPQTGLPAGPPGPSESELNMLGDYGDAARKKIRRLVRTPERARERDIKGPVTFEFEVDNTGKLLGVKAIESAHKILEQECFEATRVAAPFGKFPPGVSLKSWKFRMTLEFPIV